MVGGWEDLARLDPAWAVLSDPARKHNRWDREEFLATGRAAVAPVVALAPAREAALDFGCGTGRLTHALAAHFDHVVGVDTSPTMLRLAAEDAPSNCRFASRVTGRFDLVLSLLVIQHVADKRATITTLARHTRGLLAIQIPGPIPWQHRLQLRPRAYGLARHVVPARALYWLGLHPIRHGGLPEQAVWDAIRAGGCTPIERRDDLYLASA
jgi:SAM-dependent methyltransferase